MRTRYITVIVVLVTLAVAAAVVYAGSLDSPALPTAAGSQMYTLQQIYDRINTGAAATKMTTFTEPSSGPTAGTMVTLTQIYDLAGQRSRPAKTGQTTSSAAGDDGALQKGVTWPSPRFVDDSGATGVVTDTLTGLIWLKNANCAGGTAAWSTALSYANALFDGCTNCFGTSGDCGLSDGSVAGAWRLPNLWELQSLVHYGVFSPAVPNTAGTAKWTSGDPFTGVQSSGYWSSTTVAQDAGSAWVVNLGPGDVGAVVKTITNYVWPVRGGQ